MKIFNRYPADVLEKGTLLSSESFQEMKQSIRTFSHKITNRILGKKMMQVLCVLDRSCNLLYLIQVLKYMESRGWVKPTFVNLDEFVKLEDISSYDLLIYQTWSCEKDYSPEADQKFEALSIPKILFDSHASGSFDTYSRFDKDLPRIKNAPHKQFLKDFNKDTAQKNTYYDIRLPKTRSTENLLTGKTMRKTSGDAIDKVNFKFSF